MQFGAPLRRQCRRCLWAVVDFPLPVPSSKLTLWLLILQRQQFCSQRLPAFPPAHFSGEPEPTEHPGPGRRGSSILQLCRMARLNAPKAPMIPVFFHSRQLLKQQRLGWDTSSATHSPGHRITGYK